jgi:uncharacterized protein YjbI with pentapeptide repeats
MAPRLPASLTEVARSDLDPYDEWRDERVAGADLAARIAGHVEISACELRNVRLTGAHLERLRLIDVLLVDCELSGALLHESSFLRVELRNCRATGLVVAQAKLAHVRFVDCKLDDANFRFARAGQIVFDRCSLVGADFYDAEFTTTVFSGCNLTNAEFSKASMAGARLAGSRLEAVRGAGSLAGAIVATDQVLPLALGVFADLGIVVEQPIDQDEPG